MKFSEKSDRYRLNGGTGVALYLVLLMFHSRCLYSPSYSFPASSPVARDHWGIFELIIKESGDEGGDGKGRKSFLLVNPYLRLIFPETPSTQLFARWLSPSSQIARLRSFLQQANCTPDNSKYKNKRYGVCPFVVDRPYIDLIRIR